MMARILVRPPPDPLAWPGSRLILATDEIIAHGTGPRPRVGFVAKISRDPGQARGSGGGQEGVRRGSGQGSGHHFSLYT